MSAWMCEYYQSQKKKFVNDGKDVINNEYQSLFPTMLEFITAWEMKKCAYNFTEIDIGTTYIATQIDG